MEISFFYFYGHFVGNNQIMLYLCLVFINNRYKSTKNLIDVNSTVQRIFPGELYGSLQENGTYMTKQLKLCYMVS